MLYQLKIYTVAPRSFQTFSLLSLKHSDKYLYTYKLIFSSVPLCLHGNLKLFRHTLKLNFWIYAVDGAFTQMSLLVCCNSGIDELCQDCMLFFITFQTFSIGLSSGLFPGHFITFIFLTTSRLSPYWPYDKEHYAK